MGRYWLVLVGTWSVWSVTGFYLVSMGRYWLVLGSIWSVLISSGWYLVVLGQYGAVLVGTWWYWVSITRYCLVLSCIGSVKCLYACIHWKKWRFGRVLPIPHTQTTEYRATQLV